VRNAVRRIPPLLWAARCLRKCRRWIQGSSRFTAGNPASAVVDVGGRSFVVTSDDQYLDSVGAVFERDTVRLIAAVARGSGTALDVGANIGLTTLLLSSLAKQVHAFEPSPTTFAFLESNLERAGVLNVCLHNLGLGATARATTLTYAPSNRAGAFMSEALKASAGHATESVRVRTCDEIVESVQMTHVDFIKIDVEGFEAEVLRGAVRTLAKFRPTCVLELNHWCLNAFQRTSVPDFVDYLRNQFPILLAIDGSGYLDLYDQDDLYTVMYQHINHGRFSTLVGAFDEERLTGFMALFKSLRGT